MFIAFFCGSFLLPPTVGAASPGASLVSLRVTPESVTLHGARAAQRFVVLGMFADGLERDVTSQARFSLSDPRLASLDRTGRVMALADGEVALNVVVGKRVAR